MEYYARFTFCDSLLLGCCKKSQEASKEQDTVFILNYQDPANSFNNGTATASYDLDKHFTDSAASLCNCCYCVLHCSDTGSYQALYHAT